MDVTDKGRDKRWGGVCVRERGGGLVEKQKNLILFSTHFPIHFSS